LFDTWKSLAETPIKSQPVDEVEISDALGDFDKKLHKGMKAVAEGATIVDAQHIGEGQTMSVFVVLAKDGSVRAVWMRHGDFE
jgi:hypothetical protein